MSTFKLTILAADKPFYNGPCESLIVPSLDGKYGIMAHYCNAIVAVVPGTLFFRPPGESNQIVAVSHGVVKVENNDVLVLVDSIERVEDIDVNRAQRAISQAQKAMLQKRSFLEYRIARAQMERAMNRLRIKGSYNPLKGPDQK